MPIIEGICNYCGQHGDMFISGNIDREFWCVDEDACDERVAVKDARS